MLLLSWYLNIEHHFGFHNHVYILNLSLGRINLHIYCFITVFSLSLHENLIWVFLWFSTTWRQWKHFSRHRTHHKSFFLSRPTLSKSGGEKWRKLVRESHKKIRGKILSKPDKFERSLETPSANVFNSIWLIFNKQLFTKLRLKAENTKSLTIWKSKHDVDKKRLTHTLHKSFVWRQNFSNKEKITFPYLLNRT